MSKHVIASLIIAGLAGHAFAATADTTATTQTARLEASRTEPDRRHLERVEARTADTAADAKTERSAARVEFRKDRQGLPRWWN